MVEDPVGALKRLRERKNSLWKQVIAMSGKVQHGYGLNAPPVSS
jgi:hypothetical protein